MKAWISVPRGMLTSVHDQKEERSSGPKYQRCGNDRTPFPPAVPNQLQSKAERIERKKKEKINGLFARGEYLGLSDDSTQGFQSNYSAVIELYITTCALPHSQR